MAKSSTTHVIEIETGIGEPAFIPLTLGNETQPISVGKKGMWRIESARVLDIHAFVYFDGNALFMQSADEESAATVDGYKIGKAWTELHAPCKIEIGAARLRYRSLLPESEDPVTAAIPVGNVRAQMNSEMQATGPQLPPPPRPPPPSAQSAPTLAQDNDEPTPITRNEPIPRDEPTRNESLSRSDESPRSQRPAPSGPSASMPTSTPSSKPERPFRPGAFSVSDADENTRWKPIEGAAVPSSGGSRPAPPPHVMQAMQMTGPVQALPPMQEGAYSPIGQGPMQPPQSMPPMMVHGSMPPVMQPPSVAPGMGSGVPSGTMHIPPSAGGVPHGTMPTGPTGPMQMPGGAYGSGGYPTAGGYPQQQGFPPQGPPPNPVQAFVATFKTWNPVKKAAMILLPISLLLGIVSLFDNDAPAPTPHAKVDGGVPKIASSDLPAWPPGVPCPPPNWPPETPLPCKPNGVVVVPQPPVTVAMGTSDGGASNPSPLAPGGKVSLQRQAVDAVVQGDIPRAASLYEELARREPNITVYAESARILRAKLDAGL